MANFDMRDQKVQYQYNADIINLNNVSNRTEFVREMENISSEIARASTLDAIDATGAKQVQESIREASVEAQKPEPNKTKITSLLETAGGLVKGATALGGLYMAITKALELAHRLF